MEKIENLQRIYSKKIPEVKHLNYWDRLKELRIYSQERRMERYRALYIMEDPGGNFSKLCPPNKRKGKIPVIEEGSL